MPRLRPEEEGGLIEKPVDASGRVALPADFADDFDLSTAYLMFWTAPCLRLVSPEAIGQLQSELEANFPDAVQREWVKRRTVGTKRRVVFDENMRIRIPTVYLDFLELPEGNRRVVMLRYAEGIIEIWNPDTYRRLVLTVDFTRPFWAEALTARMLGDNSLLLEAVRRSAHFPIQGHASGGDEATIV
ncbi:MAG: hypothetical protein H5T86_14130 [Armatimonadetes bacterium]|nr:hypothetical protein [Armatimonadota bacterium]